MDNQRLFEEFFRLYGGEENVPELYFAPGRVNLIGEHTDYNGGYVLPCAIQFGTYLLIRRNQDNTIRLASMNFFEKGEILLDKPLEKQSTRWFNYPLGVLAQFEKQGLKLTGLDLLFYGDIPNGAGLSSSASIEMATAFAVDSLMQLQYSLTELAKFSQLAEHEFAGVMCGIMDQFAVAMGKKDHAVFLNTETLEYKQVPVILEGYDLIIINSNKQRGLADSKYNERVAECRKAVAAIGGITNLGQVSFMQFFKNQNIIEDETIRKRARHVISENQRVLNSVKCLSENNILEFGALMNASHESLRDNYEVTGIELDTLAEEAWAQKGCIGARMTGAGFGGCTVNIVKKENTKDFIRVVGEKYQSRIGLKADFYLAEIGDGVRKVE
ncbi:MAG: galactokinase [Syntrophothermus sp.]